MDPIIATVIWGVVWFVIAGVAVWLGMILGGLLGVLLGVWSDNDDWTAPLGGFIGILAGLLLAGWAIVQIILHIIDLLRELGVIGV